MKVTTFILLCFSTASVLGHGYMPGRLEDAAARADQAVVAKIAAIKETPIYYKLKDGTQGPLLTTQRDYTLEISRILAGPEHKPGVVTYTEPQFVEYDENGEQTLGMWVMIDGSGIESRLEIGKEYALCLQNNREGQPPDIVRAEPIDRTEAVTAAMRQSQCWAVLKTALTSEEFKSIRLVAYDSANSMLAVMIPSPPRSEQGKNDRPEARIYAVTPNGMVTCSHEFDTYRNCNHLYFDGKTVILRASNDYTMVFLPDDFTARTVMPKPQ